jgi:hypothetical protein
MRDALSNPGHSARLTANNGRYRAEATLGPLLRQELLRDLSEAA